jgi:hypothetical protein
MTNITRVISLVIADEQMDDVLGLASGLVLSQLFLH